MSKTYQTSIKMKGIVIFMSKLDSKTEQNVTELSSSVHILHKPDCLGFN